MKQQAYEITNASLENLGLSLSNLRGQGYDRTFTISRERGGIQARILYEYTTKLVHVLALHHLVLQ